MVPLVGSLGVAPTQIYALEQDKQVLQTLRDIGILSQNDYGRRLNNAGVEQALTGLGALLGGVPGKVGKALGVLSTFG